VIKQLVVARTARIFLAAIALAAANCVAPAHASYQGEYHLVSINSVPVPAFHPGVIRGEGTTLVSMKLELLDGGRYRGSTIRVYTDSGSVVDTILEGGSWAVRGDSLFIDDQWLSARWQSRGMAKRVGLIERSEITLMLYESIGPTAITLRDTLRFRRS